MLYSALCESLSSSLEHGDSVMVLAGKGTYCLLPLRVPSTTMTLRFPSYGSS
jgi:hypothetical protein